MLKKVFLLTTITIFSISLLDAPLARAADSQVSITFSGDILPHTSLYEKFQTTSGYDFTNTFKELAPLLNGDLNLCHLETVLTNNKPSSYPVFGSPVALASSIKLHWQGCSGASNHTLDKGTTGVKLTKETFQNLNLGLAGTKINSSDDPISYYPLADGHTLAYLAYTYGTNGITSPSSNPEIVNRINYKNIKEAILQAHQKADLIILYMHWGTEYQEAPSSYQKNLAAKLLALPELNAIVGSHVHVLQPAALINNKPVLYGLGNLWSGQGPWSNQPKGQIGAIAKLTFIYNPELKSFEFSKGRVDPTLTLSTTWKVYPASALTGTANKPQACLALKTVKRLFAPILTTPSLCS